MACHIPCALFRISERRQVNGDSALIQCCRADDAELARVLVEAGADVNQPDHGGGGGQTPLVICATLGSEMVLRQLLAAPEVDLTVRYNDRTAVDLARAAGNTDAAQLILDAAPLPAAPTDPDGAVVVHVCSLPEKPTLTLSLRWSSRVAELVEAYQQARGVIPGQRLEVCALPPIPTPVSQQQCGGNGRVKCLACMPSLQCSLGASAHD